jgi:hypothetical protein
VSPVADRAVLLPLLLVLLVAFAAGVIYVAVPVLRAQCRRQQREVAERLAVLLTLPLDTEPLDYAAGADRLAAAVEHGRHRRPHFPHQRSGGDR